jgi:hypothetical protein
MQTLLLPWISSMSSLNEICLLIWIQSIYQLNKKIKHNNIKRKINKRMRTGMEKRIIIWTNQHSTCQADKTKRQLDFKTQQIL